MKKLSYFISKERHSAADKKRDHREQRRQKIQEVLVRVDALKQFLDIKDPALIDEGAHEAKDPFGNDGVAWRLTYQIDIGHIVIQLNSWSDVVLVGLASDPRSSFKSYGKHETEKLLTDLARLIFHNTWTHRG